MADGKSPPAAKADAPTQDAPAQGEEQFVVEKPRKGWLKGQDGRFHEVEDVAAVTAAYPGQYELVKEGDVVKSKVGWPEAAPQD